MKIKKIIAALIVLVFVTCILSACSNDIVDMSDFNYAIVRMPDGSILEGPLDDWTHGNYSDRLYIKIDGIKYLVNSNNCVLIRYNSVPP